MIENIEDCLEHLAGMRQSPVTYVIETSDFTIMNSIARQVFKGTALTDRQFALMQTKLVTYKAQFSDAGVKNLEDILQVTRQPLRQIDRSKFIKIQDDTIVVRFPFKKSDIVCIQSFSLTAEGYSHKKGSHQHSFAYNEVNVMHLLTEFSAKDFTIDPELVDVYNKVKEIFNTPQLYLSGIADLKLINIQPALGPIIQDEIGDLSNETFTQFIDRRFRYGFNHVEGLGGPHLTQRIASRKDATYHSRPSLETTNDIMTALWDLNRFPLLVVLDTEEAEHQLLSLIHI